MAKITFDTRTLRDALKWVTDHIDPTPSHPANAAVVITPASAGHLILTGARDQSAGRARVAYKGADLPEAKAVHAHSLYAIVRSAPGPDVQLTLNDNEVQVKSGTARSKLTYLDVEAATAAGSLTQLPRQGTVQAAEFIAAVSALASVPKEDASTPELSGVKVNLVEDNRLVLAATDRSILGTTQIGFKRGGNGSEELVLDVLIPHRTFQAVTKSLPVDGDVHLGWDPNSPRRLAISTDTLWASVSLLAAGSKFPDYKALLAFPEGEQVTTFEADRRALTGTLARAIGALGRDGLVLGVDAPTTAGTATELTVHAEGIFSHEEAVPARVTGPGLDKALLSAPHVTQAIKSLARDEEVRFDAGGQRVVITSGKDSDTKFVIPRIRNR